MPFSDLPPSRARELLADAGVSVGEARLRVELREERWLVHLPGDRLAWLPRTEEGRRRLALERRVLRLIEARCLFGAPRIVFEDDAGELDVRVMVPGTSDPWRVFEAVRHDTALAQRLGTALGLLLAEQHSAISGAEVAGWLPRTISWPEPRAWICERLPRVIQDPEVIARSDELIVRYESLVIDERDRVLVHGDVGFHNLAFAPDTLALRGIFDYDGAAFADRHHDFRYLLFDHENTTLLDAALAAYEPRTGVTLDRARIRLYNAACAITFLAHRDGTPPDQRCCGRTLVEDLRWTSTALSRC